MILSFGRVAFSGALCCPLTKRRFHPFGQDFYQTYARITGNQGLAQIFWGSFSALNTGRQAENPQRGPFSFLRESRVARNSGGNRNKSRSANRNKSEENGEIGTKQGVQIGVTPLADDPKLGACLLRRCTLNCPSTLLRCKPCRRGQTCPLQASGSLHPPSTLEAQQRYYEAQNDDTNNSEALCSYKVGVSTLTIQPLLFFFVFNFFRKKKVRETPKKSRVFLFAEPLKSWKRKEKRTKSKGNRKTKKENRKRARIGGSGYEHIFSGEGPYFFKENTF